MGEKYINLTEDYPLIPIKDIHEYIISFFNAIVNLNISNKSEIDINSIKEFIDLNYIQDIYLEQIADKYNTSSSYLSRLFKDTFGMSFQKYLSLKRISQAKTYLLSTSKTINEIAASIGYNNRVTFVRMFKNLEGISPSEYRTLRGK
jgi:YesN/AraC family two-component response regulator